MKLILIFATAVLVTGEDLVNYHANNMYHHIQSREASPNVENSYQSLFNGFYGTPVEQSDLTGPIVDSAASADFPLQNYEYSFDGQVDSPGYSPENRKKWESVEFGAWGGLRVALDQIPITPAGTFKVDTPNFYNQWHINRNNLYPTN